MTGKLIYYDDFTRGVNGEGLLDLGSPLYNIAGQTYAQMHQVTPPPSGTLNDWFKTNTITANSEGANWTGQTLQPINYQSEAWGSRPIPKIPFVLSSNYGIAFSLSIVCTSTFNYNNLYGQLQFGYFCPNGTTSIARTIMYDTGTLFRSQLVTPSDNVYQDGNPQYGSGQKMIHISSIFNPNVPSMAGTWAFNISNSAYGSTATYADSAIDGSVWVGNQDGFIIPFDFAHGNASNNTSFSLQKIMIHTFPLDN